MIGDFVILPDGQDSILIGILCGVSGGDSRCGRDRGSNVTRKKRPGGAKILFPMNRWLAQLGLVAPGRPLNDKNFHGSVTA